MPTKTKILIGTLVTLVLMLGGLLGKNSLQPSNNTKPATQEQPTTQEPSTPQDNEVTWYSEPKQVLSPNLLKGKSADEFPLNTWEIGVFNTTHDKIYFVTADPYEMGGSNGYIFSGDISDSARSLQTYSRYSSGETFTQTFGDEINTNALEPEYGLRKITSLEYPGFITFNNTVLAQEGDKILNSKEPFFHPEKDTAYKKVFIDKIYGPIYLNTRDGGFYIRTPFGTAKAYSLIVGFFKGAIPQVTWSNGNENRDPYTFRGGGGCGLGKYIDDVSDQIAIAEISPTGKAGTGEIVYEYKDKTTSYLKDWYEENKYNYSLVSSTDFTFNQFTTLEQFANNHPVFFWKDSTGRLIRAVNTKYILADGCGKPVIYLYPPTTTSISVNVYPTGGLTVSDPSYGDGWHVIADTQSNLTNLADGKSYPYLFWEGHGTTVNTAPKRGFVIARADLESTLNNSLKLQGLNQKEISDFKEFWLPRMLDENKPYYFVTFISQRNIDALAPLKISPTPDTIIRVLMDYEGLDNKITVPEIKFKTPKRTGFTAVEWGGVLH